MSRIQRTISRASPSFPRVSGDEPGFKIAEIPLA